MTDEAKKALMAEARAKAAAQSQAQAPIAPAIEQSSKFITAPELSDRSGIDARNLTRGDADSDGYAAATYDADAVSDTAVPAPVEPVYTPPPPAALPEPESPVNQRTHPFWFMAFSLVAESTEPSCHLMLVESPTLYASTSTEAGADMVMPTRLWRREAAGAMGRLLVVPVG